jgi:hypothetical protein
MNDTVAAAICIGGILFGYLFGKYQDRNLIKKKPTDGRWDEIVGEGVPDDEKFD